MKIARFSAKELRIAGSLAILSLDSRETSDLPLLLGSRIMTRLQWALLLVVFVPAPRSDAAFVYDNTTNDSLFALTYSSTSSTELGDQITLAGTERLAQKASVLFYNAIDGPGMFDATLRVYEVGSPVGTQIGGSFMINDIAIGSTGFALVDFSLGGLLLPDEVIFTLSVDQPMGLDVGLNVFDPPTIGSSSDTFFIANDGVSFNQETFGGSAPDNLYFSLDATAIPESAPWPLAAACLMLGALWRMRQWFQIAAR
jgi:hypothetical protein